MTTETTDTVKAQLFYSVAPKDGSSEYEYINADSATGQRIRNFTLEPYDMEVENLRGKEDTVSLDTAGFAFVKASAQHKSFADDEEVKREYYPESIGLLKKLTGASRVVLFDHSKLLHDPFSLLVR